MPDDKTTEVHAWAQCPCEQTCRKNGLAHPCIECWAEAGDGSAGLRLHELKEQTP